MAGAGRAVHPARRSHRGAGAGRRIRQPRADRERVRGGTGGRGRRRRHHRRRGRRVVRAWTGTARSSRSGAPPGCRMEDERDESIERNLEGLSIVVTGSLDGVLPRRRQGGDPDPRRQGRRFGVEEDGVRGGRRGAGFQARQGRSNSGCRCSTRTGSAGCSRAARTRSRIPECDRNLTLRILGGVSSPVIVLDMIEIRKRRRTTTRPSVTSP